MATTNYTTLYARGDKWLEDADNFAFPDPSVKAEALKSIINDDVVVSKTVIDNSLTTIALRPSYTVDPSYMSIEEVRIDLVGDGYGTPVSRSSWDFVDGNIVFGQTSKYLPAGKNLILFARKKLTDADSFDELLSSYILHMYCAQMLRVLAHRKNGRFLRNQTTMSDIVGSMQEHKMEAEKIRKRLPKRRAVRQ